MSRRTAQKSKHASSPHAISKGPLWEYRLARLRFYQGLVVRRSVDVWDEVPLGEKLAELDYIAVNFDPQLRRSIEVCEAKTGTGRGGEIDRILWLRGVAPMVGATSVVLAKLSVDDRSRRLARRLDVDVLDEAAVKAAEATLGIHPTAWVGPHDPELGEQVLKPARERLTASTELRRVGRFLFGTYWFSNEFTRLQRLRTLASLLREQGRNVDQEALALAAGELSALFTISAFEIASWRHQFSTEDYRSFLSAEFSAGLGDVHGLRVLLRRIDAMNTASIERIHERYTATGAGRVAVPIPQLEEEILRPPEWVEALIDLTGRLTTHANLASACVREFDLLTAEHLGSRRDATPIRTQWTPFRAQVEEVVGLVQHFLTDVWGTPKEFFTDAATHVLPKRGTPIPDQQRFPTVSDDERAQPSASGEQGNSTELQPGNDEAQDHLRSAATSDPAAPEQRGSVSSHRSRPGTSESSKAGT